MATPRPGAAAIRDARSVADGLYSLNAEGADRYGFTVTADGKEVHYGEFLYPGEAETRADWVLDRKTNTVRRAVRADETETTRQG